MWIIILQSLNSLHYFFKNPLTIWSTLKKTETKLKVLLERRSNSFIHCQRGLKYESITPTHLSVGAWSDRWQLLVPVRHFPHSLVKLQAVITVLHCHCMTLKAIKVSPWPFKLSVENRIEKWSHSLWQCCRFCCCSFLCCRFCSCNFCCCRFCSCSFCYSL